jgi:hypothetical protein
VSNCLNEPLAQHVDAKELLCLAAVLDVAAERAAQVPGAAFTQQQRLAKLDRLCRQLAPRQQPLDTLAALGIIGFYPNLAAYLAQRQQEQQQQHPVAAAYSATTTTTSGSGSSSGGTTATAPTAIGAYLGYVAALSQVVMMGTQLYNDALAPARHKYAAHQIALLYVSWLLLLVFCCCCYCCCCCVYQHRGGGRSSHMSIQP